MRENISPEQAEVDKRISELEEIEFYATYEDYLAEGLAKFKQHATAHRSKDTSYSQNIGLQ